MGGSLLIDLARFWAVYVFTGLVLVVLSTAKRDILSQQNDLFYLHDNGVTILCPDAPVGSWGLVDGVNYTKRDREGLDELIAGDESAWNLLETTCTSGIDDMSNLFADAISFNESIGTWDTSRVTDMGYMFWDANSFNQPIGNWDTSQVANMFRMFVNAISFNQPIGDWNTSQVTDMSAMFLSAISFNQAIGHWNTS
jgi:surface protein